MKQQGLNPKSTHLFGKVEGARIGDGIEVSRLHLAEERIKVEFVHWEGGSDRRDCEKLSTFVYEAGYLSSCQEALMLETTEIATRVYINSSLQSSGYI